MMNESFGIVVPQTTPSPTRVDMRSRLKFCCIRFPHEGPRKQLASSQTMSCITLIQELFLRGALSTRQRPPRHSQYSRWVGYRLETGYGCEAQKALLVMWTMCSGQAFISTKL
ncbi:hypothetical protein L917_11285 [Phytophthora nicotianae]|uniref:Uncharacterized protein n=3 Tax=Phytophthora nicotianae TaxID=4792 RepID=V9EXF9_PHYNI|nr:hypothetical protein F443_11801 [Phytophthora nicotianae P1569]ETL89851.1 hypothetical protein L917_11285 [Phytophthora nicotianae]ETM43126.1 hypothetical protein L914_11339 [Phytophthora nicotianae]ETO71846.1 hypothetical protein F444_11889 [Phytophthora nicotianae P1976]